MNILLILSAVVGILASLALFLWAVIMRKSRKKQTNGDSTPLSSDRGDKGRSMKYWWSIPLVLVVGVVVWGLWGTLGTLSQSLQAPSLKTVWVWTKNYWLWILIASGIVWGYLSFVQKKKDCEVLAKSLKSVLVLVLLTLFVVFPSIVTVKGSYEEYSTKAGCSHFGSSEIGSCYITEDGVTLTSAEAFPDGKFELCYLKPEKAQMTQEWLGPNAIRFKSQKDKFLLTYKMIERKTLVNGNCPERL